MPAAKGAAVAGQVGFAIVRRLRNQVFPGENSMAGNTEHSTDTGSTDMAEHIRTWKGFIRFMTWQVVGAVVLLILLAIFRTHG
jgi:hypothetical protein